jgi:hypothetical protein
MFEKGRKYITTTVLLILLTGLVTAIRPGITIVKSTGLIDGQVSTEQNTTPIIATVPTPQLIGGQTDSHGCLIAAGFSWNDIKQVCIREFSGEIQLASGTMMVNVSDPNWREKLIMPTPISTDVKCIDSDNGRDYFTAGKVYVQGQNPKMDACVRHRFLREWFCSGTDTSVSAFVVCKRGCKDGACIPEVTTTTTSTSTTTTSTIATTTILTKVRTALPVVTTTTLAPANGTIEVTNPIQ